MKINRHSLIRTCLLIVGAIFLVCAHSFAQTNSENKNAPPKLSPPYGELPPTFWEQHASSLVFACLGVIVLITLGLCIIFRTKAKIIIPPEVQAREILKDLRRQPETGVVLSQVSQTVRSYFSAAFQLSPGELTTTEFCREISGKENIGGELSTAVAGFLRDCDAHKFSSTVASVKLDAANRALSLVEQAEQRRGQLRHQAETQVQGQGV
jgi:hypothetical protein